MDFLLIALMAGGVGWLGGWKSHKKHVLKVVKEYKKENLKINE